MVLPLFGVGQNWESIDCANIPAEFMVQECAVYGDTIDPVSDSELFAVEAGGLWQYGPCYKPIFDSISPFQGWVTDSIDSYGIGLNTSLYLSFESYTNPGATFVMFQHKLDIQAASEGAFIEVSCDSIHWQKVDEVPTAMTNYYHYPNIQEHGTMFDTAYMFTGTFTEWIWSGFQLVWGWPVVKGDENRGVNECNYHNLDNGIIHVRFTFQSDDVETGQAGWMIRKVVVGYMPFWGSVSESEYENLSVFPNPTNSSISIRLPENNLKATQTRIYDMTGRLVHQQVFDPTMDVGYLEIGTYILVVETEEVNFRGTIQKY